MHIHNVADYAPPGHRLLRTEYRDGATCHVFGAPDGTERVCEVRATSADEERAALERFKAGANAETALRPIEGGGFELDLPTEPVSTPSEEPAEPA